MCFWENYIEISKSNCLLSSKSQFPDLLASVVSCYSLLWTYFLILFILICNFELFINCMHFNFQAIDKELELKEGFENFTSQQQRPAPVAKPWSHPVIQQQQQQPGMLYNQNQTTSLLMRIVLNIYFIVRVLDIRSCHMCGISWETGTYEKGLKSLFPFCNISYIQTIPGR